MALKKLQTLFKDTVTGLFYNYNNTGTDLEQVSLGSGSVTTVTGSSPISVSNNSTTPNVSISTASSTETGVLSATDWNTFNSKTSNGINLIGTEKPLAHVTETVGNTIISTIKLYDPFPTMVAVPTDTTFIFDCATGFNKRISMEGNITISITNAENGDMGCVIITMYGSTSLNISVIAVPSTPYLAKNKAFTGLDPNAGTYILTWVKENTSDFDSYYLNLASYKGY